VTRRSGGWDDNDASDYSQDDGVQAPSTRYDSLGYNEPYGASTTYAHAPSSREKPSGIPRPGGHTLRPPSAMKPPRNRSYSSPSSADRATNEDVPPVPQIPHSRGRSAASEIRDDSTRTDYSRNRPQSGLSRRSSVSRPRSSSHSRDGHMDAENPPPLPSSNSDGDGARATEQTPKRASWAKDRRRFANATPTTGISTSKESDLLPVRGTGNRYDQPPTPVVVGRQSSLKSPSTFRNSITPTSIAPPVPSRIPSVSTKPAGEALKLYKRLEHDVDSGNSSRTKPFLGKNGANPTSSYAPRMTNTSRSEPVKQPSAGSNAITGTAVLSRSRQSSVYPKTDPEEAQRQSKPVIISSMHDAQLPVSPFTQPNTATGNRTPQQNGTEGTDPLETIPSPVETMLIGSAPTPQASKTPTSRRMSTPIRPTRESSVYVPPTPAASSTPNTRRLSEPSPNKGTSLTKSQSPVEREPPPTILQRLARRASFSAGKSPKATNAPKSPKTSSTPKNRFGIDERFRSPKKRIKSGLRYNTFDSNDDRSQELLEYYGHGIVSLANTANYYIEELPIGTVMSSPGSMPVDQTPKGTMPSSPMAQSKKRNQESDDRGCLKADVHQEGDGSGKGHSGRRTPTSVRFAPQLTQDESDKRAGRTSQLPVPRQRKTNSALFRALEQPYDSSSSDTVGSLGSVSVTGEADSSAKTNSDYATTGASMEGLHAVSSVSSSLDGNGVGDIRWSGGQELSGAAEALFHNIEQSHSGQGFEPNTMDSNDESHGGIIDYSTYDMDETDDGNYNPTRSSTLRNSKGQQCGYEKQRRMSIQDKRKAIHESWRASLEEGQFQQLEETYDPMEMRRQELIWEFHESERAFVDTLRILVQFFVQPLRTQDQRRWINGLSSDVTRLFDWLDDITNLHEQLLDALESMRQDHEQVIILFSETIQPFISLMELYQPYIVHVEETSKQIASMTLDPRSDFGEFVRMKSALPECEVGLEEMVRRPSLRLREYVSFFQVNIVNSYTTSAPGPPTLLLIASLYACYDWRISCSLGFTINDNFIYDGFNLLVPFNCVIHLSSEGILHGIHYALRLEC
ncbi:unnamed protein product, partial [Rhizoctonia solani]